MALTAGLGPQMAPQAPTDQTAPPAPPIFSKRFFELALIEKWAHFHQNQTGGTFWTQTNINIP